MTVFVNQNLAARQKFAVHAVRNVNVVFGLFDRIVIKHHDFATASVPTSVMVGLDSFGNYFKRKSIVVVDRQIKVERFVALYSVRRMDILDGVRADDGLSATASS